MDKSTDKTASEQMTNTEIIFQGQRMFLGQVFAYNSTVDESLLNLKPLEEIGKTLEFEDIRLHINRKFLLTNSDQNAPDPVELSSEELLSSVDGTKIVLLSGERGHGKTTELKLFAKLMKIKCPAHWIVFLNLADHFDDFDDREEESPESLIRFFNDKLMKNNELESKVFMDLFRKARVVIFFDGFDEIKSTLQKFVVKLIKSIEENGENQVWIAARPQAEKELTEKLNGKSFTIKHFFFEDQDEFAKRLVGHDPSQPEEIFQEKTEKIVSFLNGLNSYRSGKVNNPIIFRLLIEAYEEKFYSQQSQLIYFPLYERFASIMIRKFLEKFKREEGDIFAFHHKHALIFTFQHMSKSKEIIENYFKDFDLPSNSEMTKVGFVSSNGSEEIEFLDLTLAEFFVADFFLKQIFLSDKNNEKINEIFGSIWSEKAKYSCRMVTKFLDSAFETSTTEELDKFQATFARILPEKVQQEVFRLAVFDDCANLIRIISMIFKGQQNVLFEMWSVRRFGTNALMMAVDHRPIVFIEKLMTIAHSVLSPQFFKELFLGESSLGPTNIYFAAASNRGALPYLLKHQLNPLSYEESMNYLTKTDKSGANILMQSCDMGSGLDNLKTVIEIIKEKCSLDQLKAMMSQVDRSGKPLLLQAITRVRNTENFVWLISCFKELFTLGEIKEMFLSVTKSQDAKYQLNNIVRTWNVEKTQTFFNFLEEIFPEKAELKEILAIDLHGGVTMFHYSTENPCAEAFCFIKSKYQELFSIEEMREILNPRIRIFLFAVQGNENLKTIESLWIYLQEVFDTETLKRILLERENQQPWPAAFWQDDKRFYDIVAIFDKFVNDFCTEEEAKAFREIPLPENKINPNARFWS